MKTDYVIIKKCVNCGTGNSKEIDFCSFCGLFLAREVPYGDYTSKVACMKENAKKRSLEGLD